MDKLQATTKALWYAVGLLDGTPPFGEDYSAEDKALMIAALHDLRSELVRRATEYEANLIQQRGPAAAPPGADASQQQ